MEQVCNNPGTSHIKNLRKLFTTPRFPDEVHNVESKIFNVARAYKDTQQERRDPDS